MPSPRKQFDPQPSGLGAGVGAFTHEYRNERRKRRKYRTGSHWSESGWLWLIIFMVLGWGVLFEAMDWLNTLGLLP